MLLYGVHWCSRFTIFFLRCQSHLLFFSWQRISFLWRAYDIRRKAQLSLDQKQTTEKELSVERRTSSQASGASFNWNMRDCGKNPRGEYASLWLVVKEPKPVSWASLDASMGSWHIGCCSSHGGLPLLIRHWQLMNDLFPPKGNKTQLGAEERQSPR